MFKSYFKTALRNFRKNKITTAINILGLSIGISAALIIFMVVEYDFSFDKHEPGKERIYRIVTDGEFRNRGVPSPLHEAIQHNTPGIETTVPIFEYNDWNTKVSVQQDGVKLPAVFKKQEKIVFVKDNYFSIFPHEWLAGNAKSSFQNPYNLVLSESRAKEYFPDLSPGRMIGKTVVFSDTVLTTVTGIVKDVKANSDFEYQAFISLSTLASTNLKETYNWDQWNNTNSNTQLLVKLRPNVQPQQIDKQLAAIFKDHDPDNPKTVHHLQPLIPTRYQDFKVNKRV